MKDGEVKKLCSILLTERQELNFADRKVKMDFVLRLLGAGTMLTLAIMAPGTARLFRGFKILGDKSDKNEWKVFNDQYLRNTIKYLEKKKFVQIKMGGDKGVVILTENGKKRILENAVSEMTINKPAHWDRKWRIVLYDINYDKKGLRDHFQKILKNAGFYQLQESVYIHAYPCEKEIEFMRNFLGLTGEVRLIVANSIENDAQFKAYFDLH